MKRYLDSFREEIEQVDDLLNEGTPRSERAILILLGRIGYAVERGDLTAREGWELDDLLGGALARYVEESEIANGVRPEGNPIPA